MSNNISIYEKLGTLATSQLCDMLSCESNFLLAWLKAIARDKRASISTMLSKFFEDGLAAAGISATVLVRSTEESGPALLIQATGAATNSSAHVLAPWLQELYLEAAKLNSPLPAEEVGNLTRSIKPPSEKDGHQNLTGRAEEDDVQSRLGRVLIAYILGLFTHDDRAFRIWVETTRPPEPWREAARSTLGQFVRELLQTTGSTAWPILLSTTPDTFVINVTIGNDPSGNCFNINLNDWLQRYCALASNKEPLTRTETLALIEESDPPRRRDAAHTAPSNRQWEHVKTGGHQDCDMNVDGVNMMRQKQIRAEIEHPFKELPSLSVMKVATITHIHGREADGVSPGMYIIVPSYFPNQCKVINATVGAYARIITEAEDGTEKENFLVRPAATAAEAWKLYQEMLAGSRLPAFIIDIRSFLSNTPQDCAEAQQRAPLPNNIHGHPDCKVTCVCGRSAMIIFNDTAGRYRGPDGWRLREYESPDMHLPSTWFCGEAGHYGTESVEILMPDINLIKGFTGLSQMK